MPDDTTAVDDIVAALTLEEKLGLVHGAVDPEETATGYVPGVERLGVPEFRLVDGPLGVRVPGRSSTAFPASISLAATFDADLARRQGVALGREAKAHGQDAVLGPGLNIIRTPHCGRNFEYFSEDPLLSGAFAAAVVEGIQAEDVVATPKHYVANNQETGRTTVSAAVSERTLRELYLPGFRAAVDAGAGSVMTSYNRVDGTHMSDHHHLVTEVLKDEWGFDGYVVSDWFGTESTVGAANAGLDLEMPGISQEELRTAFGIEDSLDFEDHDGMPDATETGLFAEPLGEAVENGDVHEGRLDDMVARLLRQMKRIGLFDDEEREGELDTPSHRRLAESIARRGSVLLTNDGALPLDEDADVAVLGSSATSAMLGGGGSSEMDPFERIPTADGIRERASGTVTVERGIAKIEDFSFFEDSNGSDHGTVESDIEAATAAAEEADVALVVVRDTVSEAIDRADLGLPGDQDELVEAVAAVNDRTVVVVQSSGPVELPWRDDVAAILESWYPGQADGDAIAAILYGDADPGGRLPVTFAPQSDYPTADERAFPGVDDVVHYDEGAFVGYRHFDAERVEPTFPFGHGLSYADYEYRDAELTDDGTVSVTVENVADRDGREVVQAYVSPPEVDGVSRPVRELGGFTAIEIPAGETVIVRVSLDDAAFRRYDEDEGWLVDEGEYGIEIGRSTRDIRLDVAAIR
ncbi:glycoside hydrolase family 3 C-terminal domain-containing protein [Haladaptatus sp. DYF46]|uniref:beta-glucosidase n=1 Tax=Haladaptatus sp. DYF46 TaxID=2886041 RepID=UPI001E5909EF|nr:glycoside hydrolase family 3 C-terminal domain-containing protein [Haladaptatus sp. DYF46]